MNLKHLFGSAMIVAVFALVGCKGETATEESRETAPATTADANMATPGAQNAQVSAEQTAPVGPTTTIAFEETDFDFGSIKEGEKVKHTYKFKNTGKEPLVISSAKGSCGCTVPKWPSEPIAPGGTGQIDVEFDSKGKPGKQTKRVTVVANTEPAQTFLNISGNVEKDPNAPAAQAQPATK